MASSNLVASNTNTFVMTDLPTNKELTNSGIDFGKQFNTIFNTYNRKSGELVTIIRTLIKTSASKPQDFAVLAGGFATRIDRKSWNSASTFFRTEAKKQGYKISMTCDRNEKNKKANLLKASFIKIDIKAEEKAAADTKAKKEKADTKAAKQHDENVIAEHVQSHGNMVEMPTTQKAIIEHISNLLNEATTTTLQVLFTTIGTVLEQDQVKKLAAIVEQDETTKA